MDTKSTQSQAELQSAQNDRILKELAAIEGTELDEDEVECLRDLILFEKKIDKALTQKMTDIQENLTMPSLRLKGVIRVHIYTNFKEVNGEEHFDVSVVGKLLTNEATENSLFTPKNFSNYVKLIQFIPLNDQTTKELQWKKDQNAIVTNKHGFVFSGKVTQRTTKAEIRIMFDSPHIYVLEPALQRLVGKNIASRQEIISCIWEYIKANNLQDRESKNYINCDSLLKEIFEIDYIKIDMISLSLKKQIKGVMPHKIPYEFTVESTPLQNEVIYDLIIDLEPPNTHDTMPFFVQKLVLDPQEKKNIMKKGASTHPHIKNNEKIKGLELTMLDTVNKISQSASKKQNFANFKNDPSLYIENLILQQNKFLNQMKNYDLKKMRNCELDERSLMEKLMSEYQDIAFDEIRKFTSKLLDFEDFKNDSSPRLMKPEQRD